MEEDDAVGVGAAGVVGDAPAVGGFGEVLGVDEEEEWVESGFGAGGEDDFFEAEFGVSDFADFEGDVTSGLGHAAQFATALSTDQPISGWADSLRWMESASG